MWQETAIISENLARDRAAKRSRGENTYLCGHADVATQRGLDSVQVQGGRRHNDLSIAGQAAGVERADQFLQTQPKWQQPQSANRRGLRARRRLWLACTSATEPLHFQLPPTKNLRALRAEEDEKKRLAILNVI